MEKQPDKHPRSEIHLAASAGVQPDLNDDGTRQLLRAGGGTLLVGIFAALLTKTVFGGIGIQGPHTNSGWLSLLVAMMCLPFGFLLFLLGAAKWLRNRWIREKGLRTRDQGTGIRD
jgi:hypothetical protein